MKEDNKNSDQINESSASNSSPSFSNTVKNITGAIKNDNNGYRSKKSSSASTNKNDNNKEPINKNNIDPKSTPFNKALDIGSNYSNTLNNLRKVRDLKNGANDIINNIRSKKNQNTSLNNKSNTKKEQDNPKNQNTTTSEDEITEEENKSSNISLNPLSGLGFGKKKVKTENVVEGTLKTAVKSKIALIAIGLGTFLLIVMIPILLLSNLVGNFTSLLGINHLLGGDTGGIEFAADDKNQEEYFNNLKEVSEEYKGEEKTISAQSISAVFYVLQIYDPSFTYSDMSKSEMRRVADLMLDAIEQSDGSTAYRFNEATLKKNLAENYFPSKIPGKSTEVYQRMTDEVYEYMNNYDELINYGTKKVSSTGGMCTYEVNGISASNIKVRLMQAGAVESYGHCGGTYGEPIAGEELVDFEKYVLGVAYGEIGEGSPENIFKAQLIMARTFALNRVITSNGTAGRKLVQENGQWILQITNCVSDQVYCDPDKGCSKDVAASNQYGMLYSGLDHPYIYKGPLAEDSIYRQWAKEVSGKVLVDSSGNVISTGYNASTYDRMQSYNAAGYDYTDILIGLYGASNEIKSAVCTSSGGASTGEYALWRQYDSRWAATPMDGSGYSLQSIGCLVTSLSVGVAKSDVLNNTTSTYLNANNFNPGTFVEALNSIGGIDSNGAYYWSSLPVLIPEIEYVGDQNLRPYDPATKLDIMASHLNNGQLCTVRVLDDPGQHWVYLDYIEGDNIYMVDPAGDETNMWSRYNRFETASIHCYRVK